MNTATAIQILKQNRIISTLRDHFDNNSYPVNWSGLIKMEFSICFWVCGEVLVHIKSVPFFQLFDLVEWFLKSDKEKKNIFNLTLFCSKKKTQNNQTTSTEQNNMVLQIIPYYFLKEQK